MSNANISRSSIQTIARLAQKSLFTALRDALVAATGDALAAMVLDRMIFWQERSSDPDGWVWKSAAEMSKELHGLVGEGKVRCVFQGLVDDGLLERRKSKRRRRTYEYRVALEELERRLTSDPAPLSKEEPRDSIITTDGPVLTTNGSILTPCGPYIETTEKTKEREDFRSVALNSKKGNPEQRSATTEHFHPDPSCSGGADSSGSMDAAELALQQGVTLSRAAIWHRIDPDIRRNRPFNAVFGAEPKISWTSAEKQALRHLEEFCAGQWSDIDPATAVGALLRATFHPLGKPFKIVGYWAKYAHGTVTLKPWLRLGGREEEQRQDFLLELAATPAVQRTMRRIRSRGGNGVTHAPAMPHKAHEGEHTDHAPLGAGSTTDEAGIDHPATSTPSGVVDLKRPQHGVAGANSSQTPESPVESEG